MFTGTVYPFNLEAIYVKVSLLLIEAQDHYKMYVFLLFNFF